MKVAIVFTRKTGLNFDVNESHVAQVRRALPDADIYLAESTDELVEKGVDPDILIAWVTGGGHFVCEDFCMQSKNLKWIHGLSAGVEGVTQTALRNYPGLQLSNAKGIHGIPISENVIGYIINHYRALQVCRENQREKKWVRFLPDELYGKTLVILGMGSIAMQVARRAKAFDMHVIGVKRNVTPLENVDEVLPETQMDEAIARADTLVMLLPYTEKTAHLMNAEKFALMKPGAFFVNVGRGTTVDTNALIDALQSGRLSGAALDAIDPEPLNTDSPLWEMPNVFITPHMSAETPLYMQRAFGVFEANVPYFLKGERMPSQIDIDRF